MGKELLIAWLLVLAMGVYIGAEAFTDRRAPIHSIRYEPRNSPVAPGGVLILRVYREKVRDDCPVTSVRWATNAETGVAVGLPGRIWQGGVVGADFVDLEIDTSSLPPGQYVGGIESRYDCPSQTFLFDGQFLFSVQEAKP